MTYYSGALLLLKVFNDYDKKFTIVGGMRTTKFLLNNQLIDVTNKSSGKWRELLGDAGIASASLSGQGIFTNEESEEVMRHAAFAGSITEFELIFGNGDSLCGKFLIAHYERAGNYNDEENYAITLESAGKLSFVKAKESGKV